MKTVNKKKAVLYVVIPCYNEEEVLPITSKEFLAELKLMIRNGLIHNDSRILFVDDGSRDDTWKLINEFSRKDSHFAGIQQSRNRGHQNALIAGLMNVKDMCDITITIDCDGQDDIKAMEDMVKAYLDGCDVVYGVRNNRDSDTFFKRFTAESFYKLLKVFGVESVSNHADYRLLSSRVLEALSGYKEVNLFLRGLIPLVGFKSTCVYYARNERKAGETHYPLGKMIGLAIDGITSLTVKPIHLISFIGLITSILSFIGVIYSLLSYAFGHTVSGWTSMTSIICLVAGVQLLSLGIIGEYIGKIYLETKARPRYVISDRTANFISREDKERKTPNTRSKTRSR